MFAEHYHQDVLRQLRKYKELADKAIAQISDGQFFTAWGDESNSIALIMKHMSGNMRSRWTGFLTTDGEKPDRQRDFEFIETETDTRESIRDSWEDGWARVFAAVEPLHADDLTRTVTIRSEPHTVMEAINRQLTHYAYHVGQIVFLAKHFAGGEWQSLSIPRAPTPGRGE
ncbi:MAG TPA: DUF1572 family protein [Longimicrobiaceae bacterium]|nr:DUF1572 family protein [Longimicrobiaceae bacterium]